MSPESYCPGCNRTACICEDQPDPEHDEVMDAVTLEASPEGQDWKPDQRDATRPPPAYLPPRTILRARAMIRDAQANGYRPWPYRVGA